MPQSHGRNSALWVWDSSGTCRNLSGDHNNITLTWSRDNPQTTTITKDTNSRIPGIRDATLAGAGLWTSGAGSADAVMATILAASVNTLIHYAPGGSVTGCPLYSACFLLSQYQVVGPINGPVGISYTFQIASGSVTFGTSG